MSLGEASLEGVAGHSKEIIWNVLHGMHESGEQAGEFLTILWGNLECEKQIII